MDRVKAFRLLQSQVQCFHRPEIETIIVDSLDNAACVSRGYCVRLDNSECKIPHIVKLSSSPLLRVLSF